jgi:hypothetical protein
LAEVSQLRQALQAAHASGLPAIPPDAKGEAPN